MAGSRRNVKPRGPATADLGYVTNATACFRCKSHPSRVRLPVQRERPWPGAGRVTGPATAWMTSAAGGRDRCARPALAGRAHPDTGSLLDCDGCASTLERGLRLVRRLLVDVLKQRLGRTVHQVLGLLQAEAGQRADFLDDLDLLVARGLEDDVELVLLLGLGLGGCGAAAARCRGGHRDRGRGLDVEGLLELLDEVRQLKERHLLEGVEQVVGAELGHGGHSSVDGSSSAAAGAAGSSLGVSAGAASAGA